MSALRKSRIVFAALVVAVLAIVLALLCSATASAATDGYYTYTVSDGEVTIIDVDTSISGEIVIPSTLGGYPVTSIGDSAFEYCENITSVVIPNSITSVGYWAFYGCDSLTSITIPDSITSITYAMFAGSGITNIVIPDGVTSIDNMAFYECTELTSVIIPDSVTSIGYSVFDYCISLSSIRIPDSITSIGSDVFSGCGELTYNTYDNALYLGNEDNPYVILVDTTSNDISACTINPNTKFIYDYAFYWCENLTSIVIPDNVISIGESAFDGCYNLANVKIGSGVTSIGDSAFWDCSSLTSVDIPNGVTDIGSMAFFYCENLTNVTIPNSVTTIGINAFYGCDNLTYNVSDNARYLGNNENPYFVLIDLISTDISTCVIHPGTKIIVPWVFEDCTSLASVTIPDGVTSISSGMFSGCSSLTSVVIPDSVTSIENEAFYGCSSLTSVSVGKNVTEIGSYAFASCRNLANINIPNSVTRIENNVFGACHSLTNIIIPDSVTYIGAEAFYNCIGLANITLPDSITIIDDYLFFNCYSLTSIAIPESVTYIGRAAFYNCDGLTSVTVPDSVTSIGADAFASCGGLTNIVVSNNNPDYSSNNGILFNKDKTIIVAYPGGKSGSYTIPSSVTSIGEGAFDGCTDLTGVTIGNNVISIGEGAFDGCTGLTSVTIGDKIERIESGVFSGCSSLKSIVIPDCVTSIGEEAFYNCTGLTSVTIGNKVESIEESAFNGCSSLKSIVIPGTVTDIGYAAFYNCAALTSVTIGNGVTNINSYAFGGCSSLTSITIPDSVIELGSSVLSGCSALESITLPFVGESRKTSSDTYQYPLGYIFGTDEYDGGIETKQYYYGYSSYSKTYDYFYIPASLKSVTVTGGEILNGAFYDCSGLTNVTIGNGVTNICEDAFYNCTGLSSIIIPDSVLSIGEEAFYNCSNLTSIIVPDSVLSIGEGAFSGCSSLESITIPFVGASRKTSSDTYQYPFGYIFGYNSYDGATETRQYYIYDGNHTTSDTYYIPDSLKYVTVTGGEILYGAFYNCGNLTSINLPTDIKSIGDSAFYNCTSLTSIVIPGNVTSIGKEAFYNCSSLANLVITDSVTSIDEYAFRGCSSLTNIIVPDSVLSIGEGAFSGCSSLESITIPFVGGSRKTASDTYQYPFGYIFGTYSYDGGAKTTQDYYKYTVVNLARESYYIPTSLKFVTVTGGEILCGAFHNCSNLVSIIIPDGITSIGDSAFCRCTSLSGIIIPDSVTSIDGDAFRYCNSFTSINIPDSVTRVGVSAFSDCKNLSYNVYGNAKYLGNEDNPYLVLFEEISDDITTCTIHPKTKVIYSYAFAFNSNLKTITIPKGVTNIGYMAFYYCDGLTSINIPNSVTYIDDCAFGYCAGITSINIPNSVTSIGHGAFTDCYNLTSIDIPDSVTCIDSYTFENCYSLVSISIPTSVTSIKGGAFRFCSELSSIILPSGLTYIDDQTFFGCSSLKSIIIPNGVTSIGDDVFSGCSNLKSIIIPSKVTTIGEYAFARCSSLISVTIPNSVVSIDFGAFNDCTSLSTVLYTGTPEQRANISIDDYNDYLISAQWQYIEAYEIKSVSHEVSGDNVVFTVITTPHFNRVKVMLADNLSSHITYTNNYTINADGDYVFTLSVPAIDGTTLYAFDGRLVDTSKYTGQYSYSSVKITSLEYTEGDFTYTILSNNVTVIKYNGNNSNVIVPSTLGGYPVTAIGENAFMGCFSLVTVSMPSVEAIGDSAFANCASLKRVYMPSVNTIGEDAFSGNDSVMIYAPLNSVAHKYAADNSIYFFEADDFGYQGDYAYYVSNDEVTIVDYNGNGGDVTIPSTIGGYPVKTVGPKAFYGCDSLTSVNMLGVTDVCHSAFKDCTSLTSVNMPNVTTVDYRAFEGCSNLTSVEIPKVTTIGHSAFRYCSSLANVSMPSVTTIDNSAFRDCTVLKSVSMPNVTTLAHQVFQSCSSLISVEMPNIAEIGDYVFKSCNSKLTIYAPNNDYAKQYAADNGIKLAGAEKIKLVTYEVVDSKVIFTIVTEAGVYNRVKVSDVDNLSSYIAYTNNYTVNSDGNYVFTISVPAVVGTTEYAFDGRLVTTGKYSKEYHYTTVEVEQEETPAILNVTNTIEDSKIIFTVVTKPGDYNRIKVTTADALSSSLGVGNYTVDENGNYVWTVKANAPTATTTYAFDLRTTANKYLKDYYMFEVEVIETVEIFKSASYAIEGDKIVFTVVTSAGDYNRIKVTTADALSSSLGVGNYTVDANGNYVWTVKANAPKETTTFAFDLRTTANKYLKDYYEFNVEVTETVEIFKSTSYEIVDGKVIFTAVTAAGDYNRVKIALLDNITSYVKYTNDYTVNADGDYVWTLKFDAPTAVTEYALDIRVASTSKYVRDYYYVTIDPVTAEPEPETVFVSGGGVIKDGKLTFTIVTLPTTINRVKVMLTSDQSTYVKLISSYTVDANGNYVWTATVTAPSETTSYTCDVRSSETSKYMKDFYTFEVAVVEEVELYKSVSHEIVDGKIVFTVVTAAGDYNRIKVTTADNLKGSLAVGNYTVNANGDYVWTIKATAPTEVTEYAFDLRDTGGKYLKDYFLYNV